MFFETALASRAPKSRLITEKYLFHAKSGYKLVIFGIADDNPSQAIGTAVAMQRPQAPRQRPEPRNPKSGTSIVRPKIAIAIPLLPLGTSRHATMAMANNIE